jgi:hypothetical protein
MHIAATRVEKDGDSHPTEESNAEWRSQKPK